MRIMKVSIILSIIVALAFSTTKPVKKRSAVTSKTTSTAATKKEATADQSDIKTSDSAATPSQATEKEGEVGTAVTSQKSEEMELKKLGDLYIQKGKIESAIEAYKQYIEKVGYEAADPVVLLTMGKYYYDKKQFTDAINYLSYVKGKSTNQIRVMVLLGNSYTEIGKGDTAIALLEPLALDQKIALSSKLEIFKALGNAYYAINNIDKGAEWYSKYLKNGGRKDADIAYVLAFVQEKSAPAKARMAYEENIKIFPKDYRNFLRLGIILSKNRASQQQAATMLKKAAALGDNVPMVWLEVGKAYRALSKREEEIEAYKNCLLRDPNNLEAKIRIGEALLERGLTDNAMEYLEDAYKQASENSEVLSALATGYIKMKKTGKAIELLTRVKANDPKNVSVRKALYEAYVAENKDENALQELKELIELERNNQLLLAYAKLLLKVGKLEEAESTIEEILATVPDDIEVLMTKAYIKRKQNNLDEALEIYKEINTIDPKYAPSLYERAEVSLEQDKVKWAELFYKRALEANPSYALAEVGLAKISFLYNKREEALAHLERAAMMAPDDPVVKEAIEKAKNPPKKNPPSGNTPTTQGKPKK
ncbi:MAG: tetratricopeptide repeat protein [Chitinispirillaceae bacterium]|nr:tetratricopeptide repeat protein [Chitinispirillaceae bacterium]